MILLKKPGYFAGLLSLGICLFFLPITGYGQISGTIYNDTAMSGVVMIVCGPGMPHDGWEPFVISTVTVNTGSSALYILNSVPDFSRLCVAAILDVPPYNDFNPETGDPAGINYPVAVYPCRNNITDVDIHIESDIFGSVSGEVYNDTGFTGDVTVMVGYDSVSEYWVPIATMSLYNMYPDDSVSYNFDNIFKRAEYTVVAVLDVVPYGDFDPFTGDPAGMNYPVIIAENPTGVDVHISTNVFGSISGTIYNDSTYSRPVQICYGFGDINLYWMPVEFSTTTISAGESITYSFNPAFLGTDYSVLAILDVNSDGEFNPCDDNVIGVNYPVIVDGPVEGVDIHLKTASISGYVYDASAETDTSGGTDTPATGGVVTDAGNGIADVTVTLSGTLFTNCITDSNGYYELTGIQLLGDYVVTPARSSWEFTPPSREYTIFIIAKENQDFTGSFTEEEVEEISINIGEDGAPVTIRMPEAGETKIVMPERTPEETKERKGTVGKGDYVAVIFKSNEQEVVGKEFTMRIFNLLGEQVGDPIKKTPKYPDDIWIKWIPEDLASGIYIIHVKGPGVDFKKKIPILR